MRRSKSNAQTHNTINSFFKTDLPLSYKEEASQNENTISVEIIDVKDENKRKKNPMKFDIIGNAN